MSTCYRREGTPRAEHGLRRLELASRRGQRQQDLLSKFCCYGESFGLEGHSGFGQKSSEQLSRGSSFTFSPQAALPTLYSQRMLAGGLIVT